MKAIKELVTVNQAALELKVSTTTIHDYFRRGWLKRIKIGRLTRITRDSIEELKKGRI